MTKTEKFLWTAITISCIIRPEYLFALGGLLVIAALLFVVAIIL